MIQSKFRLKVYFPLSLISAFTILIIWLLIKFDETFTGLGGGIFVVVLLMFLNLFILVTTLKTQHVVLSNEYIKVNEFLGWGKETQHEAIKTLGYYTGSYQFKGTIERIIYIVNENKKVAKLSSFYHLNFSEMEHFLEINLSYLGSIRVNFLSDFKSVINNRDKIKI